MTAEVLPFLQQTEGIALQGEKRSISLMKENRETIIPNWGRREGSAPD